MQKVGAKSGAVFPQVVVQVASSKIWDKKLQFGVGAVRCPILATNCPPVLTELATRTDRREMQEESVQNQVRQTNPVCAAVRCYCLSNSQPSGKRCR
jgi:hypothetical protein